MICSRGSGQRRRVHGTGPGRFKARNGLTGDPADAPRSQNLGIRRLALRDEILDYGRLFRPGDTDGDPVCLIMSQDAASGEGGFRASTDQQVSSSCPSGASLGRGHRDGRHRQRQKQGRKTLQQSLSVAMVITPQMWTGRTKGFPTGTFPAAPIAAVWVDASGVPTE